MSISGCLPSLHRVAVAAMLTQRNNIKMGYLTCQNCCGFYVQNHTQDWKRFKHEVKLYELHCKGTFAYALSVYGELISWPKASGTALHRKTCTVVMLKFFLTSLNIYSLTWKRPCIWACVLLLTARNQDQLRKEQTRLSLLVTSVFTLLGIVSMRHMEIIHSSIPLRKRNTRIQTDYESVCGGDSIASDVTVSQALLIYLTGAWVTDARVLRCRY